MSGILFDKLHNSLGQVLDVRKMQHALTVGNIANTDTPHYKAKVIPFDELLAETMGTDSFAMNRTRDGHLQGMRGDTSEPDIEEIDAPPWALDGNSVQIEREMVRLRANSLMFKTVLTGISNRMNRIAIITGK